MFTKRIIPCLDVHNGRVVKGVNFVDLIDAGDPVEAAKEYDRQNADEIVFLDITATHEGRSCMIDIIEKTASQAFIPVTVGGGISSTEDFKEILRAGADKVSVNSAAVRDKFLVSRAADKFGSQCVVVAIDVKRFDDSPSGYHVFINGGRIDTGIDALEWAKEVESLGAGEILLTSMNADGTKKGFDIGITNLISSNVRIPVIASGGCGCLDHFSDVFEQTQASAALAASLFHFGELTVPQVKEHLVSKGIPVRR